MLHAVLMDVLGLGVLIAGESGIGKSECALDLIVRGHRLVADDTVEVRRRAGDDPDRHLSRADAPPHGAARARRHQRQGAVRHRLDAIVEARRARRAARTLGSDARIRAARAGRRVLRDPRPARAADSHAGRARPQHRHSGRGRGAQSAAARRAATTPRACSPIGSSAQPAPDRSRARRPTRTTKSSSPEARGEGKRARDQRRKTPAGQGQAAGRSAAKGGQPFIVLTGLSGSGKSQAIRALEDLGYFCVDNLPTTLIPTLAKLSLRAGGDIEKVAIVVDVREGSFLSSFPKIFQPAAEDAAAQPGADLPRSRARRAGAALQRDAAAASAGAGSIGRAKASATSASRHERDPRAWPTRSSTRPT